MFFVRAHDRYTSHAPCRYRGYMSDLFAAVELAWSKRQVCLQRAASLARGKGKSERGMSSDFQHLVHVLQALPELCRLHSQPARANLCSLELLCLCSHLHKSNMFLATLGASELTWIKKCLFMSTNRSFCSSVVRALLRCTTSDRMLSTMACESTGWVRA